MDILKKSKMKIDMKSNMKIILTAIIAVAIGLAVGYFLFGSKQQAAPAESHNHEG